MEEDDGGEGGVNAVGNPIAGAGKVDGGGIRCIDGDRKVADGVITFVGENITFADEGVMVAEGGVPTFSGIPRFRGCWIPGMIGVIERFRSLRSA